jgi:hypothetical protein
MMLEIGDWSGSEGGEGRIGNGMIRGTGGCVGVVEGKLWGAGPVIGKSHSLYSHPKSSFLQRIMIVAV